MSAEDLSKFWQKIDEDDELNKAFFATVPAKLSDGGPIIEFAKENGFNFTEEELKSAADVVGSMKGGEELSDAALEGVAGGARFSLNYNFPMGRSANRVLASFRNLRFGGIADK